LARQQGNEGHEGWWTGDRNDPPRMGISGKRRQEEGTINIDSMGRWPGSSLGKDEANWL